MSGKLFILGLKKRLYATDGAILNQMIFWRFTDLQWQRHSKNGSEKKFKVRFG